jgi:hypothetical protein
MGVTALEPAICLRCAQRSCELGDACELAFCQYDIAYYNDGQRLFRKQPSLAIHDLSANLRHQLNPILNVIVEQVDVIKPGILTRKLDINDPASKVVAATKILDLFVQMLSGVVGFHPPSSAEGLRGGCSLSEMITKYFATYSILKDARRSQDLQLRLKFAENLVLPYCPDIWECIIAVLMDNVWKYSIANTAVEVEVDETRHKRRANISITNLSKPLPEGIDIFARGVKAHPGTEGFGLGLCWAQGLVFHYNTLLRRAEDELQLNHHQELISNGMARQRFIIAGADICHRGDKHT